MGKTSKHADGRCLLLYAAERASESASECPHFLYATQNVQMDLAHEMQSGSDRKKRESDKKRGHGNDPGQENRKDNMRAAMKGGKADTKVSVRYQSVKSELEARSVRRRKGSYLKPRLVRGLKSVGFN